MSIALITLATGPVYREYANGMVASSHKFWPEAQTIVFTDNPFNIRWSNMCVYTEPKGYPGETLYRYHTFTKAEGLLRKFDYVFYCDADMLWVSPAGDEMLGAGLTATLHPGYFGRKGTPETRKESTAFCDWNLAYYAGGFQGGATQPYLHAMNVMRERIDTDAKNGITAVWHDESHWNRFLADHQETEDIIKLPPSYCYPEDYAGQWGWPADKFKPVLVALNKKKRGNHWSQS
jgi:histo-blood group ABO system transferase